MDATLGENEPFETEQFDLLQFLRDDDQEPSTSDEDLQELLKSNGWPHSIRVDEQDVAELLGNDAWAQHSSSQLETSLTDWASTLADEQMRDEYIDNGSLEMTKDVAVSPSKSTKEASESPADTSTPDSNPELTASTSAMTLSVSSGDETIEDSKEDEASPGSSRTSSLSEADKNSHLMMLLLEPPSPPRQRVYLVDEDAPPDGAKPPAKQLTAADAAAAALMPPPPLPPPRLRPKVGTAEHAKAQMAAAQPPRMIPIVDPRLRAYLLQGHPGLQMQAAVPAVSISSTTTTGKKKSKKGAKAKPMNNLPYYQARSGAYHGEASASAQSQFRPIGGMHEQQRQQLTQQQWLQSHQQRPGPTSMLPPHTPSPAQAAMVMQRLQREPLPVVIPPQKIMTSPIEPTLSKLQQEQYVRMQHQQRLQQQALHYQHPQQMPISMQQQPVQQQLQQQYPPVHQSQSQVPTQQQQQRPQPVLQYDKQQWQPTQNHGYQQYPAQTQFHPQQYPNGPVFPGPALPTQQPQSSSIASALAPLAAVPQTYPRAADATAAPQQRLAATDTAAAVQPVAATAAAAQLQPAARIHAVGDSQQPQPRSSCDKTDEDFEQVALEALRSCASYANPSVPSYGADGRHKSEQELAAARRIVDSQIEAAGGVLDPHVKQYASQRYHGYSSFEGPTTGMPEAVTHRKRPHSGDDEEESSSSEGNRVFGLTEPREEKKDRRSARLRTNASTSRDCYESDSESEGYQDASAIEKSLMQEAVERSLVELHRKAVSSNESD